MAKPTYWRRIATKEASAAARRAAETCSIKAVRGLVGSITGMAVAYGLLAEMVRPSPPFEIQRLNGPALRVSQYSVIASVRNYEMDGVKREIETTVDRDADDFAILLDPASRR
jgi:hypothetical protein